MMPTASTERERGRDGVKTQKFERITATHGYRQDKVQRLMMVMWQDSEKEILPLAISLIVL